MANIFNPAALAHKGCEGTYPRTITVRGGAFDFAYNAAHFVFLHATIDANGVITGSTTSEGGGVTIKGQVSNGVINATIGSAFCDYSLQLKRI